VVVARQWVPQRLRRQPQRPRWLMAYPQLAADVPSVVSGSPSIRVVLRWVSGAVAAGDVQVWGRVGKDLYRGQLAVVGATDDRQVVETTTTDACPLKSAARRWGSALAAPSSRGRLVSARGEVTDPVTSWTWTTSKVAHHCAEVPDNTAGGRLAVEIPTMMALAVFAHHVPALLLLVRPHTSEHRSAQRPARPDDVPVPARSHDVDAISQ
jgi:hypothetical protein